VQLIYHFHDGDGPAKHHAQGNKLTLGGTESNLGLSGRPSGVGPSIHDDEEAMPGLGSVRVFACFIQVPVASKLWININMKGQASGP